MIVVAGALAQRPGIAGHAWVFLNWMLGLRALGFDVLFVDRLEPEMLDDPRQPVEASPQWKWLHDVMAFAGFENNFALLYDRGRVGVGVSRADIVARARGAHALLNFMGYLDDQEIMSGVGQRVFVDIDPGFPQLWRTLGLHDAFAGHDAVATVGLAADSPACIVADTGLPTFATLPPVSLDHWPAVPIDREHPARVTSIATWRGPFAPIEHDGIQYGLRVHQFRRFLALPGLVPAVRFEVALDIDPSDSSDIARLGDSGWYLLDPRQVAAEMVCYRNFIAESAAELVIAKGMYVQSAGGWFSDRSACYLASGRPVIAQDTGFGNHLPTGKGLLSFDRLDEAAAAVAEVAGNLELHAAAARRLAEEWLDARIVLRRLLHQLDVI